MTTATRRDPALNSDPELLTRTSWVNADIAYRQVKRGRADGNTCALWLRLQLQRQLYSLGCFLQLHCGKVLFLGLLLLSLCCVGLKTATIETDVDKLWVEAGGRLERELEYTKKILGEGSGTTYEMIVQIPKTTKNLLNMESLMLHFHAVLEATQTQVEIDGITWKFGDICYSANFPSIENPFDHILHGLMPCVIITPLDCFWEGSLLLGPDYGVHTGGINDIPEILTWANLNPAEIVKAMMREEKTKDLGFQLAEIMNTSGVGTAYQEKPCLNPHHEQCPATAFNKHNKQMPDLGGVLTGGCSGFSSKYMRWPEDLLFGGVMKNKTGYISRVEAYQSVLQLMGETELYQYWDQTAKTSGTTWNVEVAKTVLQTWQRKFVAAVNAVNNSTARDNVYAFSFTSLLDIMQDFSNISVTRVVIGYILMFIYACISLMRWNDAVHSQSGIGMAGVVLVSLSVAAGLGICSVLGITFNASTTQIIPFLALGLGVDDMFLIAHAYSEVGKHIPCSELSGEVLKRTGVTVLLTSVTNMLAFFTAAMIPIPALRTFSTQAGVLVLFNVASVLIVFPAIVSLDLVRKEDNRIDVLCCFLGASPAPAPLLELQQSQPLVSSPPTPTPRPYTPPPAYSAPYSVVSVRPVVTRTSPEGARSPVTSVADVMYTQRGREATPVDSMRSTTSSQQCLTPDDGFSCGEHCGQARKECSTLSLTCLALRLYGLLLEHTFVRVTVMVSFFLLLVIGAWGVAQVRDGLDLTDIVPRDTTEFKFLQAQEAYFGFYSIYTVTKGDFDYARNQRLLWDYYTALQKVERVIRSGDGAAPTTTFWLAIFRQWLEGLQRAFDRDVRQGAIVKDSWSNNASDEGILAYKLLVQTGDPDSPVDRQSVMRRSLVNSEGVIYPPAFYNYLSAWYANDAMAYAASMANIHPNPKEWRHSPHDNDLTVLKSQPIVYAQIPFFLTNLTNTEQIIRTVKEIRAICEEFSNKGLPNYPSGYPFTYWEQYINLRFYLMLALLCVLTTIFLVLTITLMNPWLAAVLVVVLSMILVELFGFMGVMGIKLSAVPAVILIMTVGIGMEFTLHVAVGFVTAIGTRKRRVMVAAEHTFAPVVHGATSTFLGIVMLVSSEFDFIVKYFFHVLAALVILGVLNGLLLLPVLLACLGPRGEVIPKDNPDRLSTPSPEPSPRPRPRYTTRPPRYPRHNSDISLSTITEEPTQYSSHEIIVQPEVVLETSTVPSHTACTAAPCRGGKGCQGKSGGGDDADGNDDNISTSSCDSSSTSVTTFPVTTYHVASHPGCTPTHVTKVKATATVKVEVHTPMPGPSTSFLPSQHSEHSYKSKRRKSRQLKEQQKSKSYRYSPSPKDCPDC